MVLARKYRVLIMTTPVAALLPPDQAIPNKPEHDGASDTPDIAFSDLWQDKEEGLSFGDLLDIINPLQHIPVISTIYRMVTGDEIGVGARLAGGALFGGPLGLAAAGTIAAIEEISGNTVENHIATLWDSGTEDGVPAPRIASTMAPKPIQTAQSASPIDVDEDGMPFAADLVDPTPTVGIGQIASTQNNESESDQLAYTIEDGMPFAEEMIEKETAYTPTVAVATTQPVAPLQVSPQPIPRPPTAVAPMAAIHRVSTTAQAAGKANAASERQRIEQAISQAGTPSSVPLSQSVAIRFSACHTICSAASTDR